MTYLRDRNNRINERSRMVTIIIASFVILSALIQFFRPSFFSGLFIGIAKPFWHEQFSIGSGILKSDQSLIAENAQLKIELEEAQNKLSMASSTEIENLQLKNLLGNENSKRSVAAVLKRPPLSPYDEFIIDVGSDYKISTSTNVYAPGNVLLGRVAEVSGNVAKVILFSSPGQKYEVMIGDSHTVATAVGVGGGQYSADLPRDAKVNEGDVVNSPGFNDKPFAYVKSVLSDPADPFERVLMAPPVNIYQLRWVLVGN